MFCLPAPKPHSHSRILASTVQSQPSVCWFAYENRVLAGFAHRWHLLSFPSELKDYITGRGTHLAGGQCKFFAVGTPGAKPFLPRSRSRTTVLLRPAPQGLRIVSAASLAALFQAWPIPDLSGCSRQKNPSRAGRGPRGWSCSGQRPPRPAGIVPPRLFRSRCLPMSRALSPALFQFRPIVRPPATRGPRLPLVFRSDAPGRRPPPSPISAAVPDHPPRPRLPRLFPPVPIPPHGCSGSAPSAPRPLHALGPALRGRGGRGRNAEQPPPSASQPLTLQGLEDSLRHLGAAADTGSERGYVSIVGAVVAATGRGRQGSRGSCH